MKEILSEIKELERIAAKYEDWSMYPHFYQVTFEIASENPLSADEIKELQNGFAPVPVMVRSGLKSGVLMKTRQNDIKIRKKN